MIQLIRGFKDILPEEAALWQAVEKIAVRLFEDFGFKEIRVPIMERTELFARSIGEGTDIVEKEMYTFPDRKGELITLRPEATACVARSYIQHKLYAAEPVRKFYTIGPMFRRERPQKGRYRQFYQINAEVFGVASPLMDVQLIHMLTTFLARLSIDDARVHINSLGCPDCRPRFKEALLAHTAKVTEKLCTDCKRRREVNPLRLLDCKVPGCRLAVSDAPSMEEFLCEDCSSHFESVKQGLDRLEISYMIDSRLVRGLDYYTRTTFEIQTRSLGAQSAVAGGGRYDGLISALGGPETPAIGFAIGFDRLVEILTLAGEVYDRGPDLFVAPLGLRAQEAALIYAGALSCAGVSTEADFSGKSLKSLMKRADRIGARFVMIIGDAELEEEVVVLRNMQTKEQVKVPMEGLAEQVKEIVNGDAD